MAQFNFTNNTYAGEALAGFMASTLLEADSVKRGLLTVIPNVKKRSVILNVDDEVVLQNPSGQFVDQGTTALQDESYLDPVVYEFMKQEQWDKLIQSWEAEQIKAGSLGDYEGVVELSDFLVSRYLTKLQIANERLYWLGKGATKEAAFTADYIGLLPKISANASTYKLDLKAFAIDATAISALGEVTVASTENLRDGDVVTIQGVTGTSKDKTNGAPGVAIEGQSYFIKIVSATTFKLVRNYNEVNSRKNATFSGTATAASIQFINVSNVLSVLSSVYAQMDYADRVQPDLKIQVPLHVVYAYKTAQAEKATNVLNAFNQDHTADYLGIKLEGMNHWFANTILVARTSNLFLGVDLLSDQSQLATTYLFPYTGDNVVRMKARMKSDTNAKFFNEILMLAPAN